MAPNDDASRLISSDGPVNRRTAIRELRGVGPVNANALARVERLHARQRLGPPLQQQLRGDRSAVTRGPDALLVLGGIACAAGGSMLLLAAIVVSVIWALSGAAAMVAGSLLLVRWRARRPATAVDVNFGAALFDHDTLARFDHAVEACATELGDAACAQLEGLKASMVRIGKHAATAQPDAHFTLDDRMFVRECVRRYVPDSLDAYLKVPRERRANVFAGDTKSAGSLLQEQLALMQAELDKRERAIGRSAAEALLQQQRFLEHKRSSS